MLIARERRIVIKFHSRLDIPLPIYIGPQQQYSPAARSVFHRTWQSIDPVVTNRRSKLPQSMTVTLDMCPRKCRVILPALRSKSFTAPPALPLTKNSSVGSKRRLSMAELFPVRLHMLLARPIFQTFTLCPNVCCRKRCRAGGGISLCGFGRDILQQGSSGFRNSTPLSARLIAMHGKMPPVAPYYW